MVTTTPYGAFCFSAERGTYNKRFVFAKDASGTVTREGWIATNGSLPALMGPDGAFYSAAVEGVNGAGITLYRAEIFEDMADVVLETVSVVDLGLPVDLPEFACSVAAPALIWFEGQAALLGFAEYSYQTPTPEYIVVGTIYSSTFAGTSVLSQDGTERGLLTAAIGFDDGTFASFDWNTPI